MGLALPYGRPSFLCVQVHFDGISDEFELGGAILCGGYGDAMQRCPLGGPDTSVGLLHELACLLLAWCGVVAVGVAWFDALVKLFL